MINLQLIKFGNVQYNADLAIMGAMKQKYI